MIRGDRPAGNRGGAKGTCPVCRTLQRLLMINGKLVRHGRTAAVPDGCAGSYQPPLRLDAAGQPLTGGIVIGFRPGDECPTAQDDPPNAAGEAS